MLPKERKALIFEYINKNHAVTTTSYLIDYIETPNVSFVTNAIIHAQKLSAKGYPVYLPGDYRKDNSVIIQKTS